MWRRTPRITRLQQWLYPELLLIEDLAERHQILCLVDPLRGWTMLLILPFMGIGFVIGRILGDMLDGVLGTTFAGPFLSPFAGIIAMHLVALYVRSNTRRNLRMELAKRGFPICIECGYDLRGQIEQRLPRVRHIV